MDVQNSLVCRGLTISPPLALAPMVGLSHSALRSLVQEQGGVGMLFTEMLAAKRLPHDSDRFSPLLIRTEAEKPLFYQLICGDVKHIQPALDKLHQFGANGVDLNLGCPAPAQRRQGAGAALAGDRSRLQRILVELRKNTELPLSVKIRLGDQLDPYKLSEFCLFLEAQGVDLITVHARLAGEKFCRKPRWNGVAIAKESVSIPVLANGGIYSVEDAARCLKESDADGLMIGRGAVERPWLLREIASSLFGASFSKTIVDKEQVFLKFTSLLEERFPLERQLGRLKQFSNYFASSFSFGHHLGTAIQRSETLGEAKRRAREFFANIL